MSLPYEPDVAIKALIQADPPLERLIEQVGPFRLELRAMLSPFQSLMRAIIYQQLSGKAAATIQRRVHALFPGDEPPDPEEILATPEDALRGAGMSRAKVAAVKDGAVVFSEEVVWEPRNAADCDYHYREIMTALQRAARELLCMGLAA